MVGDRKVLRLGNGGTRGGAAPSDGARRSSRSEFSGATDVFNLAAQQQGKLEESVDLCRPADLRLKHQKLQVPLQLESPYLGEGLVLCAP